MNSQKKSNKLSKILQKLILVFQKANLIRDKRKYLRSHLQRVLEANQSVATKSWIQQNFLVIRGSKIKI